MGGIGRGAYVCFTLAVAVAINLCLVALLTRDPFSWYFLGLAAAEITLISLGLWLNRCSIPIAEYCKNHPWPGPPPQPD